MSKLANQIDKSKLPHDKRLAIARAALDNHKKAEPTPYELMEQQESRHYSFASDNDYCDFNEHYN